MKTIRLLLTFVVMTGYLALNYGFANWSIELGKLSIPIGHALSFLALLIAFLILKDKQRITTQFIKEPVVIAWLGLVVISLVHLASDLPRYGGYAARDASFVAEGVFLFLGFLWSQDDTDRIIFLKGMGVVFLLTFLYSLTAVAGSLLASTSPSSGIFQRVPILGNYSFIYFALQTGALFAIMIAPQRIKWPKLLLWIIAILQIGWMFYFQARSTYVSILVIVIMVLVFGGIRRTLQVSALHLAGLIALLALSSILQGFGDKLVGRNGEISPTFYVQHAATINPEYNQANVSPASWRIILWKEAIQGWLATPMTILVGEGFGQPLTDYVQVGGFSGNAVPASTVSPGQFSVAVRQPHNIHLTVLARLGLTGFLLWVFIQARIVYLFVHSLGKGPRDTFEHTLKLWLFLFYITGMILASVQPWLEFSNGSIPFFVVIGFALSILTNPTEQLSPKKIKDAAQDHSGT